MEHIENESVAFTAVEPKPGTHDGIRVAQGMFLDELPGAVFAGLTLIWVLSSFAGLMWREVPPATMLHLQTLVHALVGSQATTAMARIAGVASLARAAGSFLDPQAPA
jgi:hypothetical protein